MAETVNTMLAALGQRVRDTGFTATSRDDMRLVLSWSQRMVNAQNEIIFASTNLTVEKRRTVYPIEANFADSLRISGVREDGRDLDEMDFRQLRETSDTWFRDVGERLHGYALAGRDLLVLYPGVTLATTVTVYYVKLLNELTHHDQTMELPDDQLPAVLDLSELMLNLKARQITDIAETLQIRAPKKDEQA